MVERILFAPGGATEVKQDDIIAALDSVGLDAATLTALESVTATISNLPSDYPDADAAVLLTAIRDAVQGTLDVNVISGGGPSTVALDAPTLAALESINAAVTGTVELGATTLAALESITATISNFPVDYPDAAVLAKLELIRQELAGTLTVAGTVNIGTMPEVEVKNDAGNPLAVSGPLTDTQLRASAVPVSGPLTDTQLRAAPVPVSGTVTVGSLPEVEIKNDTGNPLAVSGPLTDAQLRATAVPVSGTIAVGSIPEVEVKNDSGSPLAVTGPLTDTQLRATAVPVSGTVTVGSEVEVKNDSGSPLAVSGPLTDAQLRAAAVPVSGTFTGASAGDVAHDAVDSGNPVKIGGKAKSTIPTQVASLDRTDAWFDPWGRIVVSDQDVELGLTIGSTSLRDRLVSQRYTRLSDSVADGLASFWTQTTSNGGSVSVGSGEGLISTGPTSGGVGQISSTNLKYYPGQEAWLNSAIRFDTGIAGNTRRVGVFTVSGSTPQDGFYYELADTTLYAVIMKAGSVVSRLDTTAWSRVVDAPFTLDANYHQFELRYTANRARFYIDNVLRHSVTDPAQAITQTLDFPMTIQSINTGAGTGGKTIYVRNIGMGSFGEPAADFLAESHAADQSGANAVLTFNVTPGQLVMVDVDPVTPSDFNNYRARATCDGSTPSSSSGFVCRPGTSFLPVPTAGTVKVWAPNSVTVAVQSASK